jgi:hypothetical protein
MSFRVSVDSGWPPDDQGASEYDDYSPQHAPATHQGHHEHDLRQCQPLIQRDQHFDYQNTCCDRRFWCIRDFCGIICAVLTWGLIFYAVFVVVVVRLASIHAR